MLKEFIHDSIKFLKHDRIAHRPLLMCISLIDETVRSARNIGKKLDLTFCPDAPSRKIFGPNEVQDHLAHTSSDVLPLPKLKDVLAGTTNVTKEDEEIIRSAQELNQSALEKYQQLASSTTLELFSLLREFVLKIKNNVNFNFLLASHNDASIRNLLRNKMSTMFIGPVKDSVSGKNATREQKEHFNKNATGILGGADTLNRAYHEFIF